MLILSNGLTDVADEGFLKVANSLVERIKRAAPDTCIVSYERISDVADCHLQLNKLLLNGRLAAMLKGRRDMVLYIPFPAPMTSTALRVFVLSRFAKRLRVLLVMNGHMSRAARLLFRWSGAEVMLMSDEAADLYRSFLPTDRVKRLRLGVDTQRFTPVSRQEAAQLKQKFGFDPDRPLVLHVGHLNDGRNVGALAEIDPKYQVLLVTSTQTKSEQDAQLRQKLLSKPHVCIIDRYIPNIEQVYQMCDVYLFPTVERGHCIDAPLSCLEAAACNRPVVTTDYGEMKQFIGRSGFEFIDKTDAATINAAIERAVGWSDAGTRQWVLRYDWDRSVDLLTAQNN